MTTAPGLAAHPDGGHVRDDLRVVGLAPAVAMASLIPARKDKWKAGLPVLAMAAFMALDAPSEEDDGDPIALMLFTAAALGLALMRVVFAGYIRRQQELVRSGRPVEEVKARHVTIFLLAFAAVVGGHGPLSVSAGHPPFPRSPVRQRFRSMTPTPSPA